MLSLAVWFYFLLLLVVLIPGIPGKSEVGFLGTTGMVNSSTTEDYCSFPMFRNSKFPVREVGLVGRSYRLWSGYVYQVSDSIASKRGFSSRRDSDHGDW